MDGESRLFRFLAEEGQRPIAPSGLVKKIDVDGTKFSKTIKSFCKWAIHWIE
jgi:hypothetical protein